MDPALAFAAGFSMWLGWTAIIAAEATFFSVVVNYWAQNRVHEAVWCKFTVEHRKDRPVLPRTRTRASSYDLQITGKIRLQLLEPHKTPSLDLIVSSPDGL